jgi:hypothetical protein
MYEAPCHKWDQGLGEKGRFLDRVILVAQLRLTHHLSLSQLKLQCPNLLTKLSVYRIYLLRE